MKQESKAYTPEGISTATRTTRGFTMRTAILVLATILLTATFIAPPVLAAETMATTPADKPITLSLKDMSLADALTAIQDASGLRLVYAQDLVKDAAPVTLEVKNQPAGSVLYDLLWERGLEYVQTADTMAAVVRVESDLGLAKMAGRACHRLAALAEKLEEAKLVGDEIVVPDWAEGDDLRLLKAAIDLRTVRSAAELQSRAATSLAPSMPALKRMTEMNDADVRAGAGYLTAVAWWTWNAESVEQQYRLREIQRKLMYDNDPIVRACWLYNRGHLSFSVPNSGETWKDFNPDLFPAAARDSNDIVRAVIPGISFSSSYERDDFSIEKMRFDSSPIVRYAAWQHWLFAGGTDPERMRTAAQKMLADKSPIAQMAFVAPLFSAARSYASTEPGASVFSDDTSAIDSIFDKITTADVYFLQLMIKISRAYFKNETSPDADAALIRLATSSVGSHQAVALGITAWLMGGGFSSIVNHKLPFRDLSPLTHFAKAHDLRHRLLGILSCAASSKSEAEDLLLANINSNNSRYRLAAEYAGGLKKDLSPELRAAVKKHVTSPILAERMLVAAVVCRHLSFDETLEWLRSEEMRAPGELRTLTIAEAMARKITVRDESVEQQRFVKALKFAWDSDDVAIMSFVMKHARYYERLLGLITDFSSSALIEVAISELNRGKLYQFEWESQIADNLKKLFDNGDGQDEVRALGLMAKLDLPYKKRNVIFELVNASMLPGNDDAVVAGGFRILNTYLRVHGPNEADWGELRKNLHDPVVFGLGLINNDAFHSEALSLLAVMLKWAYYTGVVNEWTPGSWSPSHPEYLKSWSRWGAATRKDTAVMAAIGEAKDYIMSKGTADEKLTVTLSLAQAYQDDVSGPAISKLEQLVMQGDLPPLQCRRVLLVLSWRADKISATFRDNLLKSLSDAKLPPFIRQHMMHVLCRRGDAGAVVKRLEGIAQTGHVDMDLCTQPKTWIGWERFAAELDKREVKATWFGDAAALGRLVAQNAHLPNAYRQAGIDLYAEASMPDVEKVVNKIILNDSLPVDLRRSAVYLPLSKAKDQKRLLSLLLNAYERLPFKIRFSIASFVVQKKKANAESEAFAIRAMHDPEILKRWRYMPLMRMPLSKKLLTAAEEVGKNDPEFKAMFDKMLKRRRQWEAWEEKERE